MYWQTRTVCARYRTDQLQMSMLHSLAYKAAASAVRVLESAFADYVHPRKAIIPTTRLLCLQNWHRGRGGRQPFLLGQFPKPLQAGVGSLAASVHSCWLVERGYCGVHHERWPEGCLACSVSRYGLVACDDTALRSPAVSCWRRRGLGEAQKPPAPPTLGTSSCA